MSHICYEGGCTSNPKQHPFSSTRALRQHQHKCHEDTPEEETSLGNARTSKRKHDAEEEEERKRQRLEAQLASEMASREPEPQLVRPTDHLPENQALLTSSRSCCWSTPLMPDFNVQHELGAFPHVSGTHCRHRWSRSMLANKIKTDGFQKGKRSKHDNPLPPIPHQNLKTSRTPQKPTLLDYSESTPSFPPTTHATQTLFRTFLSRRFLPNPSRLDLAWRQSRLHLQGQGAIPSKARQTHRKTFSSHGWPPDWETPPRV